MLSLISGAEPAENAAYPMRPIRIIVPAASGGPPDVAARLVGEKIVIIENRPGASFTLGLNVVAKSTPDGYTLGLILMPATVSPSLLGTLPYDTEKDLAAVSLIAWGYNILAVPVSTPAKSLKDLIALAKAKPGGLKFSSGGNGAPGHLAGELLKREAKIELVHIPYKGAPAGAIALLTGDVDMMIGAIGVLAPHIKSGKVRALATSAPQRITAYPELPTFVELGYPTVQIRDWHGIVVPAASPRNVIERLHVEIAKAVMLSETKQRLEPLGLEPAAMGSAAFAAHIRDELQRWSKLVRDAGIKAD
jgi:tripartite-type tricarboxylate transporter receptor subunit TctC